MSDLQYLGSRAMSFCELCGRLKKPMQWVHGQLLVYLTRLRGDVRAEVDRRAASVFTYNSGFLCSVGVQIRGGKPDGGRKPLDTAAYMAEVDRLAEDLRLSLRPLRIVYLCSDLPEQNFISAESMTERFPNRTFSFVALPHTSLGDGEAEINLRTSTAHNNGTAESKIRKNLMV
jgi:hypothetical protein